MGRRNVMRYNAIQYSCECSLSKLQAVAALTTAQRGGAKVTRLGCTTLASSNGRVDGELRGIAQKSEDEISIP